MRKKLFKLIWGISTLIIQVGVSLLYKQIMIFYSMQKFIFVGMFLVVLLPCNCFTLIHFYLPVGFIILENFSSLLEAFDDNHCHNTLEKLKRGEQAVVQEYSFKTHSRLVSLLCCILNSGGIEIDSSYLSPFFMESSNLKLVC